MTLKSERHLLLTKIEVRMDLLRVWPKQCRQLEKKIGKGLRDMKTPCMLLKKRKDTAFSSTEII